MLENEAFIYFQIYYFLKKYTKRKTHTETIRGYEHPTKGIQIKYFVLLVIDIIENYKTKYANKYITLN